MNKVKIIGYEKRNYTDKSTGEVKLAQDVWYEELEDIKGGSGHKTDNSFINPRDFDVNNLRVGGIYQLELRTFKTRDGLKASIAGFTEIKA